MKEIKSVKFIALRDFSLGEFDCGDDIKAEDIVFIDYKEEPDIKAGEIIEIEDYRDELTDSEIDPASPRTLLTLVRVFLNSRRIKKTWTAMTDSITVKITITKANMN